MYLLAIFIDIHDIIIIQIKRDYSINNFKEEKIMNNNQKCACGVIARSHPKSIINIITASITNDDYFTLLCTDNPTRHGKPVTILQVTAINDTTFIVEFVYEEDSNNDLEKQDKEDNIRII